MPEPGPCRAGGPGGHTVEEGMTATDGGARPELLDTVPAPA